MGEFFARRARGQVFPRAYPLLSGADSPHGTTTTDWICWGHVPPESVQS